LRSKSITGRFPVLETKEGSRVCESLAIAKYLSREHQSFYGATPEQRAEVDMWIDYINSTVGPAAHRVINQVVGKVATD